MRTLVLVLAALGGSGCLLLTPPPQAHPGAGREHAVVLGVDGTPGLAYEGSYGTPAQTTGVRGTVPARYVVRTRVGVVAAFTKTSVDGDLVVWVQVDGQEVQRRSTSQPYGSIAVSQAFLP